MTTARPGPVSMATLRSQDLLKAFSDCLEELSGGAVGDHNELIQEARQTIDLVEQEYNLDTEERASEIIHDLADALNEYAPEDHYFGGHPGDGAEFGFYPIDETEL